MEKIQRQYRIRGGLYGLLVGDALGVPYEFHSADEIPPYHEIEMTPPEGFSRAHQGILIINGWIGATKGFFPGASGNPARNLVG